MPKDFAQRGNGGGRQARGKGGMPGWVWLLAGLAIGLCIAAFVYVSRPLSKPQETETAAPSAPAGRTVKKNVPLPPKEPSRFSFYEILPSQEVVIPRAKDNGKDVAPIAEPGTYIVQVGSFREKSQADAQKAQLALLGVESRVEQVTIDKTQTWYRVRIGPEKDLGKVHSIMTRLSENDISSLLVKVQD